MKSRLEPNDSFLRSIELLRGRVASFDQYPFSIPALRGLESLVFHPKITFFVGENGSGKSTLIEGIAVAYGFNPEGGSRNFNFATRPSESVLHSYLRLIRGARKARDGYFLRAESFFNLATEIERLDGDSSSPGAAIGDSYGEQPLHEQSHGEAFWALISQRFGPNGVYILDEPEAALSPHRQLALLRHLHELVATGSQLIVATHSPIILAYPDAKIYVLGEAGIQSVSYEQTEHYRLTRDFLLHRERYLDALLRPER